MLRVRWRSLYSVGVSRERWRSSYSVGVPTVSESLNSLSLTGMYTEIFSGGGPTLYTSLTCVACLGSSCITGFVDH